MAGSYVDFPREKRSQLSLKQQDISQQLLLIGPELCQLNLPSWEAQCY